MFEFVKHLFRLQFLLILIAVFAGIYYQNILQKIKDAIIIENKLEQETSLHFQSAKSHKDELFTRLQLATYNGETGAPLYLAILGSVYDVSKGIKYYGPGCDYNFFIGRDASVAFVTGNFNEFVEEEADDVVKLKPNDLLGLTNWKRFYDKEYTYKGKLIGRFYDATGVPTSYYHKYLALLEQAETAKSTADHLRTIYPDCNIQWSEEKGTRVWCTNSSGGKQRSWIGFPRKLFELGKDSFRCACIKEEELDTTAIMIKPYENCDRLAHECFYSVD